MRTGRASSLDEPAQAGRAGRSRELAAAGVQLAVLSAFALAQPLFDLLSKNAEFFAARGSSSFDIVALALGLTLVPPAALLFVEALGDLVARRLGRALHFLFVAGLAGLIALQGLRRVAERPGVVLIAAATALGIAGGIAVLRARVVRSFLNVLAPAPLVFLVLFLFDSPVSKLVLPDEPESAAARVAATAPVVMVVFDELPVISLLDARHEIDAGRFPNFARLARRSTWFRNTTTVTGRTTEAVPAILTGKRPREDALPIFSDHPDNLFTLLGGSYRREVSESATRLCPQRLCTRPHEPVADRMESLLSDLSVVYLHLLLPDDLAAGLPSISDNWMDFRGGEDAVRERDADADAELAQNPGRPRVARNRDVQVESFVASLAEGARPTLYFLHVLLPHRPWRYLPSGKDYGDARIRVIGQTRRGFWVRDRLLVEQAHQRYLLQLVFVDRLLGRLLRRLEETGLYDDSLVVVTADHGLSFRPGGAPRGVYASNLHELAPVPLFVKTPNQRRGRVVDRSVQTIDILPTVADALDVRVGWETDGRSALDPTLDRRTLSFAGGFVVESGALARKKYSALERQLSTFGSGADLQRLFQIGPHRELLGRSVADVARAPAAGVSVELDDEERFRSVDLDSEFIPAYITGRLEGRDAPLDVAVAVNGRIAAVSRSFEGEGGTQFAALVPESVFRDGSNRVELFRVESAPGSLGLARLGAAS